MSKVFLTDKQKLWAEHYVQVGNATLSAKLAGYKGGENALAVVGHRNLRNAKIQLYLSARYREVAMGADEVLSRLADMARANVSDFIDDTGKIDFAKVKAKGYVIKKVFHRKGVQSQIELQSPLRALELLGKAHALFTDKVQLDISEEFKKLMQDLELTDDDIRSDPLIHELFVAAGVEIAGVAPDGSDSGEEAA